MTATRNAVEEDDPSTAVRTGNAVVAVAGDHAIAVLRQGSGTLEAVFERCVYLRAGEGLLCAGDRDLVRGPLNLCIGGAPGWGNAIAVCRPGMSWRYRDGSLRIACMPELRVDELRRWAPGVGPTASREAVARGLHALRARLDARPADPGGARIAAAALDTGMQALERWLDTALSDGAGVGSVPGDVLALIGCGPGLTPSGDDVLVGTLVALSSLGAQDAAGTLGAEIRRHMSARTGRISAAHLAAACAGQAVEPVHEVLGALLAGEVDGCLRAGERLLGHGQSSGADALAGIVLTVTVWART